MKSLRTQLYKNFKDIDNSELLKSDNGRQASLTKDTIIYNPINHKISNIKFHILTSFKILIDK